MGNIYSQRKLVADNDIISAETIRRALRDWSSVTALGDNPLADLSVIFRRAQSINPYGSSLARGRSLRVVLQETIEELRPDTGSPQAGKKRWRPYIILTEQYLNGRDPGWIQDYLGISKGTYFMEQKNALEMASAVLKSLEEDSLVERSPALAGMVEGEASSEQLLFFTPPLPPYPIVGRESLVADVKTALLGDPKPGIVALNGLPGVGKTTLAMVLAHDPQVQEHFRDGILWAGLGRQPDLMAWMVTWAITLGISEEKIYAQPSLSGLAALVYNSIGSRRMLLIIDDAWQSEAALALKLGGAECAYLLTTRLAQVALDFSSKGTLQLRELNMEDGCHLLSYFSPLAARMEPEQIRRLVSLVGGLPLALVLIGRYLQKQNYAAQGRRLYQAFSSLESVHGRLHLAQPLSLLEDRHDLVPGTPLSLQTIIGLSDMALDEEARRALICLSLFPAKPNSFSEEAALAILAAPGDVLDRLVDGSLMECVVPDRYTIHQTIKDYAAEHTADNSAVVRMVHFYNTLVEANANNPSVLDLEMDNLVAAFEAGLRANLYTPLIRFAVVLCPSLVRHGKIDASEKILQSAYHLAQVNADQPAQARLLAAWDDLRARISNGEGAQMSPNH